MNILEETLKADQKSAEILADALRRGPVRVVFQAEFSEFGVYFLPEQFVETRPRRGLCSAA